MIFFIKTIDTSNCPKNETAGTTNSEPTPKKDTNRTPDQATDNETTGRPTIKSTPTDASVGVLSFDSTSLIMMLLLNVLYCLLK